MKPLFQTKAILLSAVLLAGGFTSCKKDKDTPAPGSNDGKTCQVTEVDMSSQFGNFKTSFTYTANGLLTETKSVGPFGTSGSMFVYNLDKKVSVREDFEDAAKTVTQRTEYTYNANGVSEIKKYIPENGTLNLIEIQRYQYEGSKPVKITIIQVSQGQEMENGFFTYTYDTDNVTLIRGYETDGNGGYWETYRRKLNYDGKATLASLSFIMMDDPNFPISSNVLMDKTELYDMDTQTWEIDEEINYTYTYNTDGLPSSASISGFGTASFTYSCQ